MKVKASKFKVQDNPDNAVTTDKLFMPRKSKTKDGDWRFHPDGIFSRRIFGTINKCHCGKTTEIGTWCPHCDTRVVAFNNMPDFYIPVDINAPLLTVDYAKFGKNATNVKNLLTYKAFYFNGNVIDYDEENIEDLLEYMDEEILIGPEAAKALEESIDDEWIEENTTTNIPIPHPIYRDFTETENGKYIIGDINESMIKLIRKMSKVLSFKEDEPNNVDLLIINNLIHSHYQEILNSIFEKIMKNKKSIIKQEVLAQSLTGAVRGVITNNYGLDEDTILIGKKMVNVLWPQLITEHGEDYEKINKILATENYNVLVNRPPTIGQLSIIAMKPQISLKDSEKYIVQTNPIIFDGLAADTDGDVFLIIAMYSTAANNELSTFYPSQRYIGASNGKIRNKLPEDFEYTLQIMENDPELSKQIQAITLGRDYEDLNRAEYTNLYRLIGDNMWDKCSSPTIGDLASIVEAGINNDEEDISDKLGEIDMIKFFDNADTIKSMMMKDNSNYTSEESQKFISKVISSNVTDISDSGWFYKKIMASCDDLRVIADDCESDGIEYSVNEIDKNLYEYRIQFSWVNELEDYSKNWDEFQNAVKNLDKINVRTPMNCNLAHDRGFCNKCVGIFKRSFDGYFEVKNIGIFSGLMITEHATQASLDSMNKGVSVNINKILEAAVDGVHNWEDLKNIFNETIDGIGNVGVQARFYEIALISRAYVNKTGKYTVASLQYSMGFQKDPLGNFIYSATEKNFYKFLNSSEFDASSIKSQIMFDIYES